MSDQQKLSERSSFKERWGVEDPRDAVERFDPDRKAKRCKVCQQEVIFDEGVFCGCNEHSAKLRDRIEVLETQLAEAQSEKARLNEMVLADGVQIKGLEDELSEAIRERDEARKAAKGVGHDWLELMEERDGYKAQRDALEKLLERTKRILSQWPKSGLYEDICEALAALERPAPADGGKA